jgi:chromosome segregation ATPase
LNEEIRKHAAAASTGGTQAAREKDQAQAELTRVRAETAAKIDALSKEKEAAQRQRDTASAELTKLREESQKTTGQAAAATQGAASIRTELEKLKAERATWEKQLAEERDRRARDAEALQKAQDSVAGAQQKTQAEIARIETAHHNAATALAEERKRIEGFRDQVTELRREKKLEANAMAENFHNLMREREASVTQIQDEMARMREQTARATQERDEAVRKAEAQMTGAREAVAEEVAALKRQLDDTNQRVADLTRERDALQATRDEMMRLPVIRPMTVKPPGIGGNPES